MITIDGSYGEGGGQIMRTALGLSLVTGKPFSIHHIRAKRKKPGLMRQHLTALNAAVEVGSAEVKGNEPGSQEFTFKPRDIRAGSYRFSIGTAGSCTLVLQTVLPALIMAEGSSDIILEGGTHNPFAPPFDFLARSFLPLVSSMGPKVTSVLEKPGFYPAGGGRMHVSVAPADKLKNIDLSDRGPVIHRKAVASVANLARSIAFRELSVIRQKMSLSEEDCHIEEIRKASGPGNVVTLEIKSRQVTEVFTGFGERGVSAERVAKSCVSQAREYLASSAAVGRHLADQLLVPMALAGGGRFTTLSPTGHTLTNIEIIKQFLDVDISLDQAKEDSSLTLIKVNKKDKIV